MTVADENLRLRKDPLRLLAELPRRFGGVARVRWGPYRLLEVTDPDAVGRVLRGNARNYVRGRFYRSLRPYYGHGMLTADGEEWWRGRRLAQPFFNQARLPRVAPGITDRTLAMLDRWDDYGGADRPVDLGEEMARLSVEVLGRIVLGAELADRVDELLPAVSDAALAVVARAEPSRLLPGWVPTRHDRRLRRARRTLDRIVDEVIAQQARRTDARPADNLVAALLAEGPPTPRLVRDQVKTVLLAGYESTGCALTWTLYAVAQHAPVRRLLEQELDVLLAGRAPTVDDLPRLPYLRQVVDESLRLHPPVWAVPRDAVADDVLGGHLVPAGSTVLIPLHTMHTDPRHWQNPAAFDPERFCPVTGTTAGGAPDGVYLPFGAGARKCIGYEMALLELQLAVGTIVQRFRIELLPAQWIRPLPLVSLQPHPRILVRVARREGA